MQDRVVVVVQLTRNEVADERMVLAATIEVSCPMPEQNERLPALVELMSEQGGQSLKRELFHQGIEIADRELVLKLRAGKEGKGIQRIGTRRYTFRTRFGRVVVKRVRIRHKSDGSTEIPSSKWWRTPRQQCITAGLKAATCEIAVKQSYASTIRQLERESGEAKILAKSSVCKIMHEAGAQLQIAQQERAAAVYAQDETALRLLGRAEAYLGEEIFERTWLGCDALDEELLELDDEEREEQLRAIYHQIKWDAREQLAEVSEQESITAGQTEVEVMATATATATATAAATAGVEVMPNNSAELVIVQPDEVVTRSQEEGQCWLTHYTAVVINAESRYYFSAPTAAQLLYQVSGLLATLKVHTDKQLLLISDGAAWIRRWYESVGVSAGQKMSVLCWFHLKKHCWRLIREAISNKEDRLTVRKVLFRYLWRGQVAEARAYLTEILNNIEDGISGILVSDIKALTALKEYLLMREQHIVDYQGRVRGGEWIANIMIEKFNDIAISMRCKKQNGMKWKQKGVGAIAALETARRNNELAQWQQGRELPAWPVAA